MIFSAYFSRKICFQLEFHKNNPSNLTLIVVNPQKTHKTSHKKMIPPLEDCNKLSSTTTDSQPLDISDFITPIVN